LLPGAWSGAGAAAAGGEAGALLSAGGVLLHPQNARIPTRLSNDMRWIAVALARIMLALLRLFLSGLFIFPLDFRNSSGAKLRRAFLQIPTARSVSQDSAKAFHAVLGKTTASSARLSPIDGTWSFGCRSPSRAPNEPGHVDLGGYINRGVKRSTICAFPKPEIGQTILPVHPTRIARLEIGGPLKRIGTKPRRRPWLFHAHKLFTWTTLAVIPLE
jgi:hypothetical protein